MTKEQRQNSIDRTRLYRSSRKVQTAKSSRKSLLKRYGLTPETYDILFQNQGRVCAICKSDTPGSKVGWHTDHNHSTGKVRGILCQYCNLMIGHAKDNIEHLQQGIMYLERFKNGLGSD